jgi:hypothetical protein
MHGYELHNRHGNVITGIGSSVLIGQTALLTLPNGGAVDTTLQNSHEELLVVGRGEVG